MTNKEAIEVFTKVNALPCGWCYEGGDEFRQALDLAIKALNSIERIKFNAYALNELINELKEEEE